MMVVAAEGDVVLNLKDSNVVKGLEKQHTQLQRIETSFAEIAKVSALAFTAVAGVAGLATKKFAEFEQKMKNVQAVSGATGKEFKKISAFAREMGAETVFSATEAADGLYFLASAGFDVEQQMSSLQSVLSLAAATGTDLAETSSLMAATLSQFGIEAENADRVADVFTKTIGTSQANMQKLAFAMRQAGPAAKAAGISFEKTTAILAKLFDAGFRGEQAGTALRGSLVKLVKPANEAKDLLKDLGIVIEESDGTMRDFADILEDLADKHIGLKEAATIFGQEGAAPMLSLINGNIDALREYGDALENAGGTAKRTAETQIDSLAGSFKLLKSAVSELQIELGEQLAPEIRKVVDGLTLLTTHINENKDDTVANAAQILLWAGKITGAATAVSLLGLGITKTIGFMTRLNPVILAVSSGVALLVPFIDQTIDALIGQAKATEEAEKALESYISAIKNLNKDQLEARKATLEAEKGLLDQAIQTKEAEKALFDLSVEEQTAAKNKALHSSKLGALNKDYMLHAELLGKSVEGSNALNSQIEGLTTTSNINAAALKEVNIQLGILNTKQTGAGGAGAGAGGAGGTEEPEGGKSAMEAIREFYKFKLTLRQMDLTDYIEKLEEMRGFFADFTEEAKSLDLELFNAREQLRQDNLSLLDENLASITDFYAIEFETFSGSLEDKRALIDEYYIALLEELNEHHENKLISTEEFEKRKKGIEDKHAKAKRKTVAETEKEIRKSMEASADQLTKTTAAALAQTIVFGESFSVNWKKVAASFLTSILDMILKSAVAAAMSAAAGAGPAAPGVFVSMQATLMALAAAAMSAVSSGLTADEGGFFDKGGNFKPLDAAHHNINVESEEFMIPKAKLPGFIEDVAGGGGTSGRVVSIEAINFNVITDNYAEFIEELKENSMPELKQMITEAMYSG